MSAPEHADAVPQPWQPGPSPLPAIPLAPWDEGAEAAPPPGTGRGITPRLVLRALRRYWWQFLLLWVGTSAVLGYAAYSRIKPTYEPAAWLRIEPEDQNIYLQGSAPAGGFEVVLETHVQQVKNPDVLGPALLDPMVVNLPRVRMALDPEADLRKDLRVELQKGTHLIKISLPSPNRKEAVDIVNVVAAQYRDWASVQASEQSEAQVKRLKAEEAALKSKVEEKQKIIRELVEEATQPIGTAASDEKGQTPIGADKLDAIRNTVSMQDYMHLLDDLSKMEFEIGEQQAVKKRLELERDDPATRAVAKQEVETQLDNDPEIADLRRRWDLDNEKLHRASGRLRSGSDATLVGLRGQMAELERKYNNLRRSKRSEIERRVMQGLAGNVTPRIKEVETRLAALHERKRLTEEKIKHLKVTAKSEMKAADRENVQILFERQELARIDDMLTKVRTRLAQVQFDQTQAASRIMMTPAKEAGTIPTDRRLMMAAAAPGLMFFLSLGLFVVLEMRAERVADPDDLPGRLRLGVIGIVPPLPTQKANRALPWRDDAARNQRDVQAFIQSLDHLRVTLWAGRRPGAGHRCVLITSACGSEGKTTLAAQLAGRCANAGLTTLLIDADLRRPALGRLLEVPEGPGLADVLAGDVEPEAALVVIGSAGGFHLLPAGTPGHDPSRLLQGERLGGLLAQFRDAFDIVIVDAPPVLAVPDALQLGRWCDGAVLAVRHDASRYSLVERANQRLAAVGVPVLGAVVNGARPVEASYSNYTYAAPVEPAE